MRAFLKEFKAFIIQGNMVSMAVGVIIATAFTGLINAFTASFLTPLIELGTNGVQFADLYFTIGTAKFAYGSFINTFISFIITGFLLFVILKIYNKLKKAEPAKEEQDVPTVESLLMEILDELKK